MPPSMNLDDDFVVDIEIDSRNDETPVDWNYPIGPEFNLETEDQKKVDVQQLQTDGAIIQDDNDEDDNDDSSPTPPTVSITPSSLILHPTDLTVPNSTKAIVFAEHNPENHLNANYTDIASYDFSDDEANLLLSDTIETIDKVDPLTEEPNAESFFEDLDSNSIEPALENDEKIHEILDENKLSNNYTQIEAQTTSETPLTSTEQLFQALQQLQRKYRSLKFTDDYKVNPFNISQRVNQFDNLQASCRLILADQKSIDLCLELGGTVSNFIGNQINMCCSDEETRDNLLTEIEVGFKNDDQNDRNESNQVQKVKVKVIAFQPSDSLKQDLDEIDLNQQGNGSGHIYRFTLRPMKGTCAPAIYQYRKITKVQVIVPDDENTIQEELPIKNSIIEEIIKVPMRTEAIHLVYHLDSKDSLKIPTCSHELVLPTKNLDSINISEADLLQRISESDVAKKSLLPADFDFEMMEKINADQEGKVPLELTVKQSDSDSNQVFILNKLDSSDEKNATHSTDKLETVLSSTSTGNSEVSEKDISNLPATSTISQNSSTKKTKTKKLRGYIKTTGVSCFDEINNDVNIFQIFQDTEDHPANQTECSKSWIQNILPNSEYIDDVRMCSSENHGLVNWRLCLGNMPTFDSYLQKLQFDKNHLNSTQGFCFIKPAKIDCPENEDYMLKTIKWRNEVNGNQNNFDFLIPGARRYWPGGAWGPGSDISMTFCCKEILLSQEEREQAVLEAEMRKSQNFTEATTSDSELLESDEDDDDDEREHYGYDDQSEELVDNEEGDLSIISSIPTTRKRRHSDETLLLDQTKQTIAKLSQKLKEKIDKSKFSYAYSLVDQPTIDNDDLQNQERNQNGGDDDDEENNSVIDLYLPDEGHGINEFQGYDYDPENYNAPDDYASANHFDIVSDYKFSLIKFGEKCPVLGQGSSESFSVEEAWYDFPTENGNDYDQTDGVAESTRKGIKLYLCLYQIDEDAAGLEEDEERVDIIVL